MRMNRTAWIAGVVGVVVGSAALGQQAERTAKYMRVREDAGGLASTLELSVRTLTRAGVPVVHLVGAVHVADQSFYDDVQAFLDAQDLVLYEGVGGERPFTGGDVDGDALKIEETEARLRYTSMLLIAAKRESGAFPATLDALSHALPGVHPSVIERAIVDAWGTPLMVCMGEHWFQLISLGADGEPGGEGAAADLTIAFEGVRASVQPDVPRQPGIQQQLADALGLEFQLRGIDYDRRHWRNSDMSVEELRSVLTGGGTGGGGDEPEPGEANPGDQRTAAAANQLFRALSGESMMSRMAGVLLRFVGMNEGMRTTAKLAMLEMVARADEILEAQLGEAGRLLEVLIVDRNTVVLDDLRRAMDERPGVESVAVFYGAGHFPDLERRMVEEMGFQFAGELWLPAITVRLDEAGLDAEQAKAMRAMVSRMLDAQAKPGRAR
ncbi:MAG: type II secretion system protein GspG [Phycisphaeraceae bacterium]|nr:type II secretion system protein GspG [Phycisphaeraceae bacterium]